MRGLFITGTDTGVGKTVLAGAIVAALRADGLRAAAFKPVVTGLDEPDAGVPADHVLLGAVAGAAPEAVAPVRLGPPASPHLAADLEGVSLDPSALLAAARRAGTDGDALIVEGVGGLLVPVTLGTSVRDLALALGLPLVVAARPGLGTINHTLLTLEAAHTGGLRVRAVVLTPWPARPSVLERSNRETIAALGGVEVAGLPPTALTPEGLARAGAALRPQRWLDR
jgi:dethiobiotin synthetase